MKKSRLKNIQCKLNASNSGGMNIIYSPPVIDNIAYDGLIADLFCTVKLSSIAAIPYIEPPVQVGLMTEAEKQKAFDEAIKNSPKKILTIWEQIGNDSPIIATEIEIYRLDPSYQEDLLPYLTATDRIGLAAGTKLIAQIRDAGNGVLTASDEIYFRGTAYEQKELDIDYLAQKYLQI